MPLRILALVASLLIHSAMAYALWPRLHNKELEVLELGSGVDVELMPQGLVMSEVASRGDDVESIETQNVVPIDARAPPLASTDLQPIKQLKDVGSALDQTSHDVTAIREESRVAPAQDGERPDPIRDFVDEPKMESQVTDTVNNEAPAPPTPSAAPPDPLPVFSDAVSIRAADDVAALEPQIPSSDPAPIASVERLNTIDRQHPRDPSNAPVLHEQKPLPKSTAVAPAKQLRDSVGQVERTREAKVANLPVEKPRPEPPVPSPVEPILDIPTSEQNPADSDAPTAPQPPTPDVLKEAKSGKAGKLPPPPELKEPKIAKIAEPAPQEPIPEDTPDMVQVLVRPTQVAVVSEASSGEEKKGGDARTVSIYLGKVNAQMQRSKVNPRTRETGVVILRFKVGTDGKLLSKEVALSSGSPVLDAAALSTLIRAAPFPPIPPEVSTSPMIFSQLFRYIIR